MPFSSTSTLSRLELCLVFFTELRLPEDANQFCIVMKICSVDKVNVIQVPRKPFKEDFLVLLNKRQCIDAERSSEHGF